MDGEKKNMKILFSVYNEDHDTEERVLKYSIHLVEKKQGMD